MSHRFAGIALVEGEPSGDGRLFEVGALNWDGMLPFDLVWDREEGDHTAMIVGFVDGMERRDGNVIWVEGGLSETSDPATLEAIGRVIELLDEGATGVSLRWDASEVELRVKKEIIDKQISEMEALFSDDGMKPPDMELTADGQRVIVARFKHDDALEVTTSARPRHLAIVDTGAWSQAKIAMVTTGSIAAAASLTEWDACSWMFDDPKFGSIQTDKRLRYDPERGIWSCPSTLVETPQGIHHFGHITPSGICLRGRPEKCLNPPNGDLEGFMRGRAPAAGGRRTGVIVCGEGSAHCQTGIGIAEATAFYDRVGFGASDVRVGRDQYGIWFSGMVRPGAPKERVYELAASDVSGHWEYPLLGIKNRATLVGLPAVNVGGFPKGYLTYEEFIGGLAASAAVTVDEGCGSWEGELEVDRVTVIVDVNERLTRIEHAIGEMYAAHLLAQSAD
jgi:hypothetical protein